MEKAKLDFEKIIYDFVRNKIEAKNTSHSFDHVERVYKLAVRIAKTEHTADMEIVKTAALLHDIKRGEEDFEDGGCHAEEGAKFAKEYLEQMGFPEKKISKVCNAILKHRKSKKLEPTTIEEKIIKDADYLDCTGAIYVARVFTDGALRGYPLYAPDSPEPTEWKGAKHLNCTISGFPLVGMKATPDRFYTDYAKRITRERVEFTKEFYNRFLKEWEGEA